MRGGLLASLFLLMPLALSGDVDVVVSAGMPADWLDNLARPVPTRDRSSPGVAAGRATVAEDAPRVFSTDVYRFAKITTPDLIGEIPWTVRKGTATEPAGRFPPPLTDDVLWLAMAAMLRHVLHPALTSESETEEYLVHVAEPAAAVCTWARAERALVDIVPSVTRKVGTLPPAAPDAPRGDSPLDTMLHRLTVEDLTCAYPFALDGRFARRIALLGEETVPHVIAATRSPHSFLRRNATLMLGRFSAPGAQDRLRELLGDADPVVQLRAVDALARRRDRRSVPILMELYRKSSDRYLKLSVIRALGVVGDRDALPLVAKHLADSASYDATLTGLAALVRLAGKAQAEHAKVLDAVESRRFADPASAYEPVAPDASGTRDGVIAQLVLLARARFGDAESAKKVLAPADGGARAVPGRAPPGPRAAWKPPVVFVLIETLGSLPKGEEKLLEIASADGEDPEVRGRALAEYARVRPPDMATKLRPLASIGQDFAVSQVALRALSLHCGEVAEEAAQAILRAYDPGLPMPKKTLVAEAARVLVARKKADPATLARILEHETILGEREKPRREPAPGDSSKRAAALWFESPSTFVEDLIVLLSRNDYPLARAMLGEILADPRQRGRAEAAVGLGTLRRPDDAPALLTAIEDDDPWVRFMAYRALKYLLGKDAPCDWIYGPAEERRAAAAHYAAWIKESRK